MKKAVLVIDMPNCCDECFALDDNGDYPFCLITHEQRGYTFKTREQKMNKCPLNELPEHELIWYDDEGSDYERGFNACLDMILNIEN